MKLYELISLMEALAPPSLAEEWDNVGLLCGDRDASIDTAVVALDCDRAALRFAKENSAQLIISHHPLIFSPLRALFADHPAYEAAANGIAVYCAHTNLDAASGGVNDALASALGLRKVEPSFDGKGRIGYLNMPMTPRSFAEHAAHSLQTAVQWRDGGKAVQRVALVSGAGGEFAAECRDADAFLTGEMKHHEWLSVPQGLTAVAAGHYQTEVVIVPALAKTVQSRFPALRVLPFSGSAPYETV